VAPEPFSLHVSDEVLEDLRDRLVRTRFPDEVPGSGWQLGRILRGDLRGRQHDGPDNRFVRRFHVSSAGWRRNRPAGSILDGRTLEANS
jgi:hypothetical protein